MLNLPQNPQFCQTRVSGSTFVNADCFDVFPFIDDKSIDAIICDLPYGTTACKWDTIIPFEPLWVQYKRIIKDNGAIVLFGSQPFTSALVMSNPKWFKYSWVWEKVRPVGHLVVKHRPMQKTEDISVFGKGKIKYNPQMTQLEKSKTEVYKAGGKRGRCEHMAYEQKEDYVKITDKKYPHNVLNFSSIQQFHPTQKPIDLLEYLVKTYTNEGDTVLDNTMGSGTTILAAIKNNRIGIGIEKEKQYYDVAVRRASEYCH